MLVQRHITFDGSRADYNNTCGLNRYRIAGDRPSLQTATLEPAIGSMSESDANSVERSTVCIIAPCFNEQEVLPLFHQRLTEQLDQLGSYRFEILLVDDGSSDDTLDMLRDFNATDARCSFLSLSRNFGHQVALTAGLDHADADAVIVMDCDLQHPPELIPEMLAKWKAGADVVSTIRKQTDATSLGKKLSSSLFYRVINLLSDTHVVPDSADFSLLSRKAHNAFKAMPERHRFLRGMISWMGFDRDFVEFEAPRRAAGTSKYTWRKMFGLAFTAVYSFSAKPLRLAIRVGVLNALLGLMYLMYVLWAAFFRPEHVEPGWTSVIAVLLIIGGVQLVFTGLIGEYVARLYEEAKQRPLYFLKQAGRASDFHVKS